MSAPDASSIVIVGAGIAGLTAALCLARIGRSATIVERAQTLDEVGAGLQLSPNALSVMDRLDLLPALRAVGVEADRVELLNYRSGRRIADVPVHAADGTPYLSIHRADLQAVLIAAVRAEPLITLTLGAALCDITVDDDGVAVSLAGQEIPLRADFLIAADGVRSAVASHFGLAPATPTGTTAWRLTVDRAAERAMQNPVIPIGDASASRPARISAWLGPRRHAVAYPIRKGNAVNLVLIARTDHRDTSAANPVGDPVSGFSRWDARLAGMIADAAPPTSWPLYEAPADRHFVLGKGRVALIGDAAHAMAPYAAQGAGMAIEDAAVLAASIAGTADLREAARRYEVERRPRIDKVRSRVGFHRFVYHLPAPFSLGRDVVLALRRRDALRADLGWLYDWRAPILDPEGRVI